MFENLTNFDELVLIIFGKKAYPILEYPIKTFEIEKYAKKFQSYIISANYLPGPSDPVDIIKIILNFHLNSEPSRVIIVWNPPLRSKPDLYLALNALKNFNTEIVLIIPNSNPPKWLFKTKSAILIDRVYYLKPNMKIRTFFDKIFKNLV